MRIYRIYGLGFTHASLGIIGSRGDGARMQILGCEAQDYSDYAIWGLKPQRNGSLDP